METANFDTALNLKKRRFLNVKTFIHMLWIECIPIKYMKTERECAENLLHGILPSSSGLRNRFFRRIPLPSLPSCPSRG
jgi:hypothetical protein